MSRHPYPDHPYNAYLIGLSTDGTLIFIVKFKSGDTEKLQTEYWEIQKAVEANP